MDGRRVRSVGGWGGEGGGGSLSDTDRKRENKAIISQCLPSSPLFLCSSNYWLLCLPSVCSGAAPLLHSPRAIEYVTSAMGLGAQGHCAP